MNLFGIGTTELLVIVLIMLVVVGPKRMLEWAYILGKYLTVLRNMWREVMKDIQKEFDEAGVDIKLPEDIPTRNDLTRIATQAIKPLDDAAKDLNTERVNFQKGVRSLDDSIKADLKTDIKPNGRSSQSVGTGFGTWSAQKQDEE